jgi:thiaminase
MWKVRSHPISDALQLVEQIRSDLRPVETKVSGHPYLRALEEGQVQRDVLKVFAGQQHHIIRSDLRSIALILSRQGMLPSLHFLMNVLQGEAAALDALHPFTRALGLTTGDLEMFEPLPAAHAYCTFVAWLALYGSDFLSCWCGRRGKNHERDHRPRIAEVSVHRFVSDVAGYLRQALA